MTLEPGRAKADSSGLDVEENPSSVFRDLVNFANKNQWNDVSHESNCICKLPTLTSHETQF